MFTTPLIGKWVDKNMEHCPFLAEFLKNIKGLRTALLSKLGPNTILEKHRGWGDLSNDVLRVHYGIKVPDNCWVGVENEREKHENNKIIVFDDSKVHWAENNSDEERIVLILDIERPWYVKKGDAPDGYTDELDKFISEMCAS